VRSDFTRNAYVSILMCPSVPKDGRISAIAPKATHTDCNEQSVQVIVIEQGLADSRGMAP